MFDKLHGQRLTKLADHLDIGKLGHEIFDFDALNDGGGENLCGTAGCALGECPIIFPNDWVFFGSSGQPFLRNPPPHTYGGSEGAAILYFGLEQEEAEHLFFANHQRERFGGKSLEYTASRYDVAANIRAFLEVKAKETL